MQGVSKVSLGCDGCHLMAAKMRTMCNNKVKIMAKRKKERKMKMMRLRVLAAGGGVSHLLES
jgi:hypothetical protein